MKPLLEIKVGDIVTWKGPRNYGYREVRGVVKHVGKICARVRGLGKGTNERLIDRKLLLSRSPSLPVS